MIQRCFSLRTSTSTSTKTSTSTSTKSFLASLGITNWWTFDNSLVDSITGLSLTPSSVNPFVSDHLATANSAIYVTYATFLTAPTGVYFSGDLSATSWVSLVSITNQARLITFETAPNVNTVTFILSSRLTGKPSMFISNAASSGEYISSIALTVNTWSHIAFTIISNTGRIYVNGVVGVTGVYPFSVPSVTRTSTWIGKCSYTSNLIDAYVDNLMFFNTGLTAAQVLTLKNSY